MEMSLCVLLVWYLIVWSGLVPTSITQTHDSLVRLQWLAHVPHIICSLIAVFIALRFPVTEQMMSEVRHQFDARHHHDQNLNRGENQAPAQS